MKWKTSWSYIPLDFGCEIGTLNNITQRTVFWNNVNGSKVRLKFSNKYGTSVLKMKEVVLAKQKKDQKKDFDYTCITLNGKRQIILLPGEEKYSDDVIFNVDAGINLVLYIHFEEEITVETSCCTWSKESWHTEYKPGGINQWSPDQDIQNSYEVFPFIDQYMSQADVLVGISEIRLLTDEDVKILTLFGDSITHMSFYADALMQMVYAKFPGRIAVLNKGIGGNKLLTDATYLPNLPGNGKSSGEAAIKRFQRDVFMTEVPDYVFVLLGVNDLMHPYLINKIETLPITEQMIEGYQFLASMAHRSGSEIYFGTILPLIHERIPFGKEGEDIRKKLNEWIRNQKEADGFFDFAHVTSKDQERMKDLLHIGDGLHPNKEGGMAMAQEVLNTGGTDNGIITN